MPGEVVSWQRPALMTLGPITVGGTLFLTNARLRFVPNKVNLRKRSPVSVELADITSVGKQDRTWQPYNGGFRIRLRVELRNAPPLLFIVKPLDEAIRRLKALSETPH